MFMIKKGNLIHVLIDPVLDLSTGWILLSRRFFFKSRKTRLAAAAALAGFTAITSYYLTEMLKHNRKMDIKSFSNKSHRLQLFSR